MRCRAIAILILASMLPGCEKAPKSNQDQEPVTLIVRNFEPELILNGSTVRLKSLGEFHDPSVVDMWMKYFPPFDPEKEEDIAIGVDTRAYIEVRKGDKTSQLIGIDDELMVWCEEQGPSRFLDDSFPAFFAEQMKASP